MIKIIEAKTEKEISKCLKIRTKVFVEEQSVPFDKELDDLDKICIHSLVLINHTAVATGRLIPLDNKNGKIGRMAVLTEYRKMGIGGLILNFLEKKALEKNITHIILEAQEYVKKFYSNHGYSERGGVFLEVGIPHIKMIKKL
ncbi:MAG: GNAT family N-acetyltransferase [Chloroflexi bacterium]|jgi:predicted GNAT family N-acyltransferase|nr:GNAT family N-acetyltransferase [Chloroflexota bacterium]|tara:strand:- start:192 stop:620 length:429 start_codon:yes stop_codon:yes gene_type:complete